LEADAWLPVSDGRE